MKVIVAPDKFKGTLTAVEACNAIDIGIKKVVPEAKVIKVPLADGGEGSLQAINKVLQCRKVHLTVLDPLSRPINSYYLLKGDEAYIEMAQASGLQLLSEEERNPKFTSTYGTGQMIKDALGKGAKRINLFVGGSATNDGGIGMAQALGYSFRGKHNHELLPKGESLQLVQNVIPPADFSTISNCKFIVLSDVLNPLLGDNGASYVYGKQKGATQKDCNLLEAGLTHLASVLNNGFEFEPGAGAAGGTGYGAMSFLGAVIRSGAEELIKIVKFEELVDSADLVITGEGSFDKQTLEGKLVAKLIGISESHNIPIGILCGKVEDKEEITKKLGPQFLESILQNSKFVKDAMENASVLLTNITKKVINEFINS